MKNETPAALALIAQGKTESGSMETVLPNAVANVALARSMAKAKSKAAAKLWLENLYSGGVPADKKPLPVAVAKAVNKLPNGDKTAAQAWIDDLRAGKSSPTNRTKDVKSGGSSVKVNKPSDPMSKPLEAPTGGDEAYTEGAGERHEAAFAGSKTKSGLTKVKAFPKNELAAERIASMTPAEWSPAVSMATFSAPGAAISGTGESLFGSGSELISVAGKMQGEIAKGSYEDRKVVLDDLMDKSKGSTQSDSARAALKLFDKAKNALGAETRKSNATFKAIGDAFDVVEKAAKSYIDELPPEQKKALGDAYSEAAAIGKQVKAEMAPIMSKAQDLAKGAAKILSEVIAEQTGESKEHIAPAFNKPVDTIKAGLEAKDSRGTKAKTGSNFVKPFPKAEAKPEPKVEESSMFGSLFDKIKKASPGLAAGIVSLGKEKDAIMKSARDKAEKISNDISKSLPSAPSFEDSVKAFDSAVETSSKLQEDGMKAVTGLFDDAEKAFDSASKAVDAEARKNGKIWVDGYIKATGDKVKGFWRKASDTVFGKKVGNMSKSSGSKVRVKPFN
jgi:hypothetical protein